MTSMSTCNTTPCSPATEALGAAAMETLSSPVFFHHHDGTATTLETTGESAIVSPNGSQTCLPQHQLVQPGKVKQHEAAFSMSELARAAAPIEASLAFPVIEWSDDDENESGPALPEEGDTDDSSDDDDDDGPVVISFRPGRSLHRKRSSPHDEQHSDCGSGNASSLRRTKSRRSSLASLASLGGTTAEGGRSLSPEPRRSMTFSPRRPPLSPSRIIAAANAIPSSSSSSDGGWGQFVAPKDEEEGGFVRVNFAVSLTKKTSSPRSFSRNRRVRINDRYTKSMVTSSMVPKVEAAPAFKFWSPINSNPQGQ